MIIRRQFLLIALSLLFAMSVEALGKQISRTQQEVIDKFSTIIGYAPGLVEPEEPLMYFCRVKEQSEALVESLYGDQPGAIVEFGFINPTHFFLELAVHPERVDQLPLFEISPGLQKKLGLADGNTDVTYTALLEVRAYATTLSKQEGVSGLKLLPGESMEIKLLENRLARYEAVRNIFKLGTSQESLSQYLAELIAFLPEGLEQYQNQLEGLPHDTEIVDRYLATLEELDLHFPYYALIQETRDLSSEYCTLEMTVLDTQNPYFRPRFLNPSSMWYADFYDAYREGDFKSARQALEKIQNVKALPDVIRFNKLQATILKGLAIFCILIGISLGFLAIPGGKRIALIAIIFCAIASICHMGWLIAECGFSDRHTAWLSISLLFNIFALLPILGFLFYRAALVLGGILLEATVIFFQLHAPIIIGYYKFVHLNTAPDWLVVWIFLSQVLGIFAVGVLWQMLFGCVVVHYHSRVIDDERLRLRQLMSITLPLLRVGMIALLLSLGISVVLFRATPGWNPFGFVTFVCGLAILVQCSIFLQLRWINRLNLIELGKNHLTLLILSLFLLLSYGDSTIAYLPDSMVTRFSPLLKWVVFMLGGIAILTFYTVPFANRVHTWINGYRKYRISRLSKKPDRTK